MKNLLNCHCKGLHSFPIELSQEGFYKRIFYAINSHELWKPVKLAIHPHHVDIKITILKGELTNLIYKTNTVGEEFKKFIWNSHILTGKGGFEYQGTESLKQMSSTTYCKGETVIMKSSELHTVQVEKNKTCVWLIEESEPSYPYTPVNYSKEDLEKWSAKRLYIQCSDAVKDFYIGKFINKI